MSEFNPYAAPQTPVYHPPRTEFQVVGGLFRERNVLVMHKQAQLPDVCIKSNQPTQGYRLKRSLSWHHPGVYLALVAGVLIYIILAMILRKQATIYVGLSEEWIRKRRNAMIVSWCSFLGGTAIAIASLAFDAPGRHVEWGFIVGFFVAVIGGIYGLIAARLVAPKRITDEYVWLKGVHPDFLAALPAWDRAI
jgi:hypothetical protein